MPATPKPKQKRIYRETKRTKQTQEIWLRAVREDVEIETGSAAEATNLRFTLYNAVRKIRENPEVNIAVADAMEIVQVTLVGEGKNIVRIGRSPVTKALDETFDRLHVTGDVVPKSKDDVDLAADESLRRLMGIGITADEEMPNGDEEKA